MRFKNKKIIITGGSRGIGLATAKAFINGGAYVLAIARNEEELKSAWKALEKSRAYCMLPADVF